MAIKSSSKSWELSLLQLCSVLGIAFFAFQHVLTTGQVNRLFFHPANENSDHGPPSFKIAATAAATGKEASSGSIKARGNIHKLPPPRMNRTVSTNYFNLAMQGYFDNATSSAGSFTHNNNNKNNNKPIIIKPLEVMKVYLKQHSQSVLKQENKEELRHNRKYLVAWYACPQHAGRRLHTLLNSLAWAVATNRTLLVGYLTQSECHANPDMWNQVFVACNTTNTERDCDRYMTLQDWVPRLNDWSDVVMLTNDDDDDGKNSSIHRSSSIIRADGVTRRDPWARPMDQADAPHVIHIGAMQMNLVTGIDLTRPNLRSKLLSQSANRDRTKSLFFLGYYFCYGMLLEALVTLQGVVDTTSTTTPATTTLHSMNTPRPANGLQSLSLALHSRHPRPEYEPAYTNLEAICIRQLLQHVQKNDTTCTVYIMSDSVKRYDQLEQQINDIGCQAQRGLSTDMDDNPSTMDAAFFDDWIFLRDSVRHGFLAPHRKLRQGIGMRPSSALLREAVEFRRVLEGHLQNTMPHECFSKHDWDKESSTADTNCTPIERLASSFGLERYQQLHGIIRDPCVWKS